MEYFSVAQFHLDGTLTGQNRYYNIAYNNITGYCYLTVSYLFKLFKSFL